MRKFVVPLIVLMAFVFGRTLFADNQPVTCVEDAYAPNHTLDTSAAYPGGSVNGQTCNPEGQSDWFVILAEDGATLEIDLLFTDDTSDLDLFLYDANGVELADSDSVTDNESISYLVPGGGGGKFHVEIFDYDESDNSYELIITGNIDCSDSYSVSTAADLNQAIACYNLQTSADDYVVTITDELELVGPTTPIDNTSSNQPLLYLTGAYTPLNVNGDSSNRILTILSGRVVVDGLSLYLGAANFGGAINNAGQLFIIETFIAGNTATVSGGAIFNTGDISIRNSWLGQNTATSLGGAIQNTDGNVSVINSTLALNTAGTGGAINSTGGNVTLINTTLAENGKYNLFVASGSADIHSSIIANSTDSSDCASGGSASVTVSYSLIADGSCDAANGSNNIVADPQLGAFANGHYPLQNGSPAIDQGNSVDCNSSATVDNRDQRGVSRPQGAGCDMGAYEAYDCTGTSWTVSNSSDLVGTIACFNEKPAGLYQLTFDQDISLESATPFVSNLPASLAVEGNGHTLYGANRYRGFGVFAGDLTISNLTIRDGASGAGGAVLHNGFGGHLTLNDVVLSNNWAHFGGGLSAFGTVSINNSTIQDNRAAYGGGLHVTNPATVINSTISGNSADFAGGIYVDGSGTITLTHSTIASNTTEFGSGAVWVSSSGPATVRNSLIADNLGGDCSLEGGSAPFVFYSLIEDGSCGVVNGTNGNLTGDPLLGPLSDNGGPTLTHALMSGSKAIDSADSNYCTLIDQRGETRPQGSGCDMGAYEVAESQYKVFMPFVTRN